MAQDVVSKMHDFVTDTLKVPADNTKTGYGQNGYQGSSSDTDLSNPTRSAMSVEIFGPKPKVVFIDQTRKLGTAGKERVVPPSFGMDQRTPRGK